MLTKIKNKIKRTCGQTHLPQLNYISHACLYIYIYVQVYIGNKICLNQQIKQHIIS